MILESDAVKIQKIKSETIKEIALEQQQHEANLEKVRMEEARIAAFKKGIFSKVLILCAILCIMLGIGGFNNCRFKNPDSGLKNRA